MLRSLQFTILKRTAYQYKGSFHFCQNKFSEEDKKSSSNIEKQERQKQIQFRKRMIEDAELQKIKQSIKITTGKFSPLTDYFKLLRKELFFFAIFSGIIIISIILSKISGIYTDPITGKKKLVIISRQYEQSLDSSLKTSFLFQFPSTQKISPRISSFISDIESFIHHDTKIPYRILAVSSAEPLITILPKSIIISKSFLLEDQHQQELKILLLVMENLFQKRYHIRQLSLSNILNFIGYKITASNSIDIKMLKIYSRKFSVKEFSKAVQEVSQKKNFNQEKFNLFLNSILNKKNQNNSSFLNLANRLPQV